MIAVKLNKPRLVDTAKLFPCVVCSTLAVSVLGRFQILFDGRTVLTCHFLQYIQNTFDRKLGEKGQIWIPKLYTKNR